MRLRPDLQRGRRVACKSNANTGLLRDDFSGSWRAFADDQVTPLTAIGESAVRGRRRYTTHHWSMVLEAQGPT